MFSDSYHPQINGVVNVLDALKKEYEKSGIETFIISTTGTDAKFLYLTVPFYKEYKVAVFPHRETMRILNKIKPDIIHSHTQFSMGTVALYAKRKLNVPLVSTFHTLIPEYFSHYFFKSEVVEKFLWNYFIKYFKKCDAVTAPSYLIKNKIQNKLNREIIFIPNGVDIDMFNPNKRSDIYERMFKIKNKKIILHVGRMSKERNLFTMIDSFGKLLEKRSDSVLVIVGSGPIKEKLKKHAEKFNENIIFAGYVEDGFIPELYASADVFITASETDVQPLVLFESFASGTPVLGVDAGGVGTMINDSNGIKFTDADDMVTKLDSLLDNKKLINKLSISSRKYVEKYSWTEVAKQYKTVYENAIKKSF